MGLNINITHSYKNNIPLWIRGNKDLYCSCGFTILRRSGGKVAERYKVEKNLLERIIGWSSLLRRVLRMEVSALVQLSNGNMVALKRKAIITKLRGSDKFVLSQRVLRGSRPLNLCLANEKVYWGEYFSNPHREEVYVYSSEDGLKWEKSYIFPARSIRHIHGIYYDEYRDGIWILTGDSDEESGLWFTGDDFKTLDLVVGGSQQARAVSVIVDSNGIIVPMDSPMEKNYIQSFDLKHTKFDRLKELPGSAFNSFTNEYLSLISTVVEPSMINKAKYAEIFASKDRKAWVSIGRLWMDIWSSLSLKIFRYPEVIFAKSSDKDPDHIYLYCRGIRKYNNCMLVIKNSDIDRYISEDQR